MILELKPEQEEILEMATRFGRSREEVLDEVFAHIRALHSMDDWMMENREAIQAKIQRGYDQAMRGELMTPEEVKRMLGQRREARKTA
jgi:predicted transcriptional regulator